MGYRIVQNPDGSMSFVNNATDNAPISMAADDSVTFTGTALDAMTREALAATGSDAAGAAVISKQVTAVTAADGTKGVALPAASTTAGPYLVINTVTTAGLPVYPVSGGNDAINGGAEDAALTLGPGQAAWFVATGAAQWYAAAVSAVTSTPTELNILTGVTASAAEINYNDITTLGTLAASKAWTSDANLDTVMPTGGLLTVQSGGAVTMASGSTLTVNGSTVTTAAAAEHGAGAIGTALAPATHRWTDRGVIITQTKIDLTGLASVADADDVIGLSTGGAAYIGRNVVATNGVIFKVEVACLETPVGGDDDINLTTSSSGAAAYDTDGAAFGVVLNSGDWVAGTVKQNLVPSLTANDYFYLTAGTGDTAAAYTAGMFVVTTYGHALLA